MVDDFERTDRLSPGDSRSSLSAAPVRSAKALSDTRTTDDPPPLFPLTASEEAFAYMLSSGASTEVAWMNSFRTSYNELEAAKLLARPDIIARISYLNEASLKSIAVSKFGHLNMLAYIRDRAISLDEVGIAFKCERSRGEVVGFYKDAAPMGPAVPTMGVTVETKDVRMRAILMAERTED